MNAQVILCDNDKELDKRLLAALREAHGQAVEVFVLDHDRTGEAVVVLLPEDGPSLAAVLRDWVQDWWSDGDEEDFGTPERYIRGLGVAVKSDDYATFSTSCPYCGVEDHLEVVSGQFNAMGIELTSDGFAFADAKNVHTKDEQIRCDACQRTFPLAKIFL